MVCADGILRAAPAGPFVGDEGTTNASLEDIRHDATAMVRDAMSWCGAMILIICNFQERQLQRR